jgi:succinate dehydrogenase hydrophobic anchor subunit
MMHSFSRLLLTAIPVFAEAKTGSDTFYYIAAGVLTVLVLVGISMMSKVETSVCYQVFQVMTNEFWPIVHARFSTAKRPSIHILLGLKASLGRF